MLIELKQERFDPYAELVAYQDSHPQLAGSYGATSIFIGTMRDFNEGETVHRLWLEHYPGMTEKELSRIVESVLTRWPVLDVLVVHRIGEVQPNDTIVLVCVWSAHRAEGLNAVRHIIEELKQRAPFWKKEALNQGTRWVEHNTIG